MARSVGAVPLSAGHRVPLRGSRTRNSAWVIPSAGRVFNAPVGGFRFETGTKRVGSLLLGLYDADGRLDHVGFTLGIAVNERAALTKKLVAMSKPPGFLGRAPGDEPLIKVASAGWLTLGMRYGRARKGPPTR